MSGVDMATRGAMDGDALKAARKSMGLSQAALADELGMARETVGQMERGAAPIERRTALAVRYLALLAKGTDAGPDEKAADLDYIVDGKLLEFLDSRYQRRQS